VAGLNTFLIVFWVLLTLAAPLRAGAAESFIPAGASRIDVNVGGATGFLFKPTDDSTKPDRTWIWYAPTLFRNLPPNQQLPNARTHWLFTRLLARGIWIAGVDVGESYGAPAGRSVYSKFYEAVTSRFHLSNQPCFLAQSRGGLMSFDWAVENPGDVRCIAGIYPVLNMASWPPRGSPLFSQAATAYGYTSLPEFQQQLIHLSPIAHTGALAKAKIPIFIMHGDSDRVVPVQDNSQRFVTAYTARGGSAELLIVHGKGHEEVDEYFKSDRLLQFLLGRLLARAGPR
jgi:pimeloyl-ACP methyl ester carboxylesterase